MPNDPSIDPERTTERQLSQPAYGETLDATAPSTQQGHSSTIIPDLPTVPGYRINGEIGKGGMGRVLAGTEIVLDREVAIKVLLPGANAERFISESKITAKLPHPGIPPIYALGTLPDDAPFLAMKFVHGRTLAAELKSRPNPLHDLPRLVQAFEQICQAVGFAHARSVVHRDLKPANIMMGEFGEVQVMDWGLAKELASRESERSEEPESVSQSAELTVAGTVMGTPAYMAPEQARGEAVDPRADVFALGGILCAMLTGHSVHSGQTAAETIQKAAMGQYTEALTRLETCGAESDLVAIARQCLSVNREERPANGRAVAELVAAYRQGVEERLHRAETERAAAVVREGEQRKRRRLFFRLGAGIAAVLVLGIAGTSVGYVQASNAADAERKAKDDAIEQKTKAEKRLTLIRGTLNSFLNELPTIGENLPLSEGVRRELMGHAVTLVNSIREQSDLNDTYDFGVNALTIREAFEAAARGDHAAARQKVEAARDGFLRIVQSQPKLLDRSRNNLAMAITELGRLAHIEKNFDRGAAYFQEALDIRREIAASPAGDMKSAEIDDAVAQSLMYFGLLESARRRFPEATAKLREAEVLLEKHLATENDLHSREIALMNLVHVHVGFATVANRQGKPGGLVQHYDIIIQRLTEELQRAPNSAGLRWALIEHSYELSQRLIDDRKNAQRIAELLLIVQRQQRWFLDTKELVELQDKVGSIHYELGITTGWLGDREAAKKHYRRAEQYWSIMVDDLEESGEPGNSDKMIGRKILRMLAQARCGMVAETERFAAELLKLTESKDRSRDTRRNYSAQAAVGYSFCAVTFPPNSPERTAYFDKAMHAMRKSVEYGYNDWNYLATDADFEPLQGLPEFQKSLKEWREKARKK